MANIHYALGANPSTIILTLKNALTEKYAAGVTIHFVDNNNLIFACPAISAKVIRLNVGTDMVVCVYYGDAWSSGTTITNSALIMTQGYQYNSTIIGMDVVLGDSLLLISANTASYGYGMYAIIALDSAGNSIAAGFSQGTGTDAYVITMSKNVTTGELIHFISPTPFLSAASELYKMPLQMYGISSKRILLDGSSNPITIPGLQMSTFAQNSGSVLALPNMFVTQSNAKGSAGSANPLACGILAEL